MKKLYGSPTDEISSREVRNQALARRAAREGFVLLQNDGALPLQNKKIALYGTGARKTVKGGTGSGAVQERRSVSIEEGLENAGYTVTTKRYLDDYDGAYAQAYQDWHEEIDQKVAGMDFMRAISMVSILGEFQWPSGRCITQGDITASDTDTAIYVLARQAGEGCDRKLAVGDWYLSEDEKENLRLIARHYAKTILVVNVGGQLDLSFLDEVRMGAVVFFAQGGMEGGNALADVLSGRYNFCGKLSDTWAKRYEDIPFAMEYSYLNGDLEREEYKEGVFVGYRYFDTFGVKPRWPFGYGLSYTGFSLACQNVALVGTGVTATVRVTNTGKAYAGREVVQAYLACPGAREAKSLVAFAKTRDLAPGEAQEVELRFSLEDAACYDEARSAWHLVAGDYLLYVGNSSRDVRPVCVITLPRESVTVRCRACCAPAQPIEELAPATKTAPVLPADIRHLTLDPTGFSTYSVDYTEPKVTETSREKELLDSFTSEELVSLVRGGDLQARRPDIHGPLGATGRTSLDLRAKGVGNVAFGDGPAGLNLMEHAVLDAAGVERSASLPEKYNFSAFAPLAKSMVCTEGTHIYRYATAWPVELLLAQTWDTELLEEIGDAMGGELDEFGVTLLLAPGMNIHRNPLCGRTFEYFSEDPVLTGKLAAAQVRGAQKRGGLGLTVKHFCCNNQEDNRTGVSSNVSERTLREIYLKGFEIAVRESRPLAVMSSYNKLNGVYTANRHDLLTDILRCEWGFQGLVMTDWGGCDNSHGDPAAAAPAGNDLLMPGNEENSKALLTALESGRIGEEQLRRCACRVLRLVLQSAVCAQIVSTEETAAQGPQPAPSIQPKG